MDTSAVFEMFETISNKLDKKEDKSAEPIEIDLSAVSSMTEKLETVIEEVRKPAKVEHKHRYTIDIVSNWIFLSLVVMGLMILSLSYLIRNQRQTINQYRNNDLKYRYIKMQGQTDEENLYRLEQQFKYNDSIKIIRKQVEKYEELVKEQAEKTTRAKQNSKDLESLEQNIETLKNRKTK
jgi:uncharacterized membrane protein YhiD involved in acid resistance